MKTFQKTFGFRLICSAILMALAFSSCKNDPPTADFTYTVDGLTVNFTHTGEGDVDAYAWSFGDGSSSTSANPSHTYDAGGSYSVTLIATNKWGDDTQTQTVDVAGSSGGNDENPQLSFSDADGALYAINSESVTSQGGFDITITLGTAVAWFGSPTSFESAGTVSWAQGSDGADLDIQPNNSYNWVETDFNTSGFSSSSALDWDVSGANSTPAFTYSDTRSFPDLDQITSETTINASEEYVLSHNGLISNADSVYYIISSSNGSSIKRSSSSVTSMTFSPADLADVGTGTAIFQIAAFSITSDEFSGKKIYFVKETVVSATGEIQ